MPTRKLSDTPRQYCRDPEHEVPSHMVFDNGLYEHECPGCGNKIRFQVNKPVLKVETLKELYSKGDRYVKREPAKYVLMDTSGYPIREELE